MGQAVLVIGLQGQAVLSSRPGSDMIYMTLGKATSSFCILVFCICKMGKGQSCSHPEELGGGHG